MVLNGSAIDSSLITRPQNVVTSGKTRSTSNQPAFIVPNGAALSLIIDGTPTNLVFDVNGTSVTVSTDITVSSLTAAPSSNNTALINDVDAADQHDTRTWGEPEHSKVLTIDNIGSEISALNGKLAAFSIFDGANTEYFTAIVDTTNNRLIQCRRGFFYNSSSAPVNRIAFADNDVITLLKAGWLFVENNGTTTDVTYTVPVWSFESPSSPATGDYWYDLANNLWKRYDGASFQTINRTLVGMFASTSSATVAARCEPFYAAYKDDNTLDLEIQSTEIVSATKTYSKINVKGNFFEFHKTRPNWNITTDLASSADMYSATEQASRDYYLYLKDTGDTVISDISPYYNPEFLAPYHPHNPWRCVGLAFNNGSSNITLAANISPKDRDVVTFRDEKAANTDGGTATTGSFQTRVLNTTDPAYTSLAWALLASNVVTLLPGRYHIMASAPFRNTNNSKIKIRNTTDSVDIAGGTSEYSVSTDNVSTNSRAEGKIHINVTKTFEIQYRVANSAGTTDLGVAANFGVNEVYTVVRIERLELE